jgi:oxygen-independent coproporphyrinogen-3 oxidase
MRWGAYLHVPWCRAICPYCAFAVVRDAPDAPYATWADRIAREWSARAAEFPGAAATVYLGGGTPSRVPVPVLGEVLAAIPRAPAAEVTCEVNPEDVGPDWLDALRAIGVNRVSLGAQSTVPRHLRRLGRPSPVAALGVVAAAGLRSWSADLMFGLPGQTLAELALDLDALLDAGAPHISVYGLTIEEGTPFARLAARGRLRGADDDLWRAMYDRLVDRLAAAGLARYEVSNFARTGHESAHNQGYWQDVPYVGLGPSAHGLSPDGTRWTNHRDLQTWLAAEDATAEREAPDPARQARDRLISGLRAREGVDLVALAADCGLQPSAVEIAQMESAGYLARSGPRIRLDGEGWPLADAITARLVDRLEPAGQSAG